MADLPTPEAPSTEAPSPESTVAEAVRRHRTARGLSNGELAARAGISRAMLSKIEHARTSCSLTTLARLAGALAVPVADLLHGGEVERIATHTPAGTGTRVLGPVPQPGYEDRRLGGPCARPGEIEAHVVTLGERADAPARERHPGTELVYVLEGAMVYEYDGTRYTLRTGDALQLDGEGAHGPRELLEAPVRFLSVVTRRDPGTSTGAASFHREPAETEGGPSMATETAILAGGCFWGAQELLRERPGVLSTRVGYSGGDTPNATYRHHGDHAEAVEVVFDPEVISYRDILEFFFQIHDPSTRNRQGNDVGRSYRSAIYHTSDEQHRVAEDTIADVDASGLWPGRVVTEVAAAGPFWEAEPEHQDYLQRRPYGYTCHFVRPNWVLPRRAASQS